MFKDRNELRKAGQQVWNWLEEVDEKENKKIDFQIPIQTSAGMGLGGVGGAGNQSRSTAQKTKQKVKSVASTTTP